MSTPQEVVERFDIAIERELTYYSGLNMTAPMRSDVLYRIETLIKCKNAYTSKLVPIFNNLEGEENHE